MRQAKPGRERKEGHETFAKAGNSKKGGKKALQQHYLVVSIGATVRSMLGLLPLAHFYSRERI